MNKYILNVRPKSKSIFNNFFFNLLRSHPPSTPARRWPLTAVSMTTTLSWLHSLGWHPPWPLTPSPRRPKAQKSALRRGLASAGSAQCGKTWTCWSATATWSTRTPAWPSLCPTCSSTPSTGACTPDPTCTESGPRQRRGFVHKHFTEHTLEDRSAHIQIQLIKNLCRRDCNKSTQVPQTEQELSFMHLSHGSGLNPGWSLHPCLPAVLL